MCCLQCFSLGGSPRLKCVEFSLDNIRHGLCLIGNGNGKFKRLDGCDNLFPVGRQSGFLGFCFPGFLSLALFLLSLVGGGWIDRSQLIFRGVMTVLLVGLLGLGWAASADQPVAQSGRAAPAVISASSPAKIALAEHLSSVGARVFTAYWCPHCHDQKEAFGKEAAAKLQVIECAEDGANSQAQLCKQQGVQGYPSWQIKGVVDSGVKPLKTLADLSGYTGPRDF